MKYSKLLIAGLSICIVCGIVAILHRRQSLDSKMSSVQSRSAEITEEYLSRKITELGASTKPYEVQYLLPAYQRALKSIQESKGKEIGKATVCFCVCDVVNEIPTGCTICWIGPNIPLRTIKIVDKGAHLLTADLEDAKPAERISGYLHYISFDLTLAAHDRFVRSGADRLMLEYADPMDWTTAELRLGFDENLSSNLIPIHILRVEK